MADVSDSEHRVKFDDQINRSIKSRPLLIRQNRKKKCCKDSCNTDSRTGILFVYSLSLFFVFFFLRLPTPKPDFGFLEFLFLGNNKTKLLRTSS